MYRKGLEGVYSHELTGLSYLLSAIYFTFFAILFYSWYDVEGSVLLKPEFLEGPICLGRKYIWEYFLSIFS